MDGGVVGMWHLIFLNTCRFLAEHGTSHIVVNIWHYLLIFSILISKKGYDIVVLIWGRKVEFLN